ncbi:hypothetical protein PENSPDRAFT_645975 [Peniophora sp. CONT]|nr:hypothetical protein PENSPDRAFT_645975 [Peniophora sp. CONT]
MESISSTDTHSERSEGVQTGDERVNIPSASSPIEDAKHSRFFYSGALVTLVVEGTLYRVHEYLFTTNSLFWSEKLNARTDKAASIKFEDVSAPDLDALLTILYDTNFQEYDLETTEDWESVLRLATRWKFNNIRTLAITKLDPLATPLQKLVMARAFDVPKWLQPSLVALCMRPGPLTLAEGKKLSTEDLISITSTREAVRQKTQVTPAEQDVSSYIAKHVLHTEPIDLFVSPVTFAVKPLVRAMPSTAPTRSNTTSSSPFPSASAPAVPTTSTTQAESTAMPHVASLSGAALKMPAPSIAKAPSSSFISAKPSAQNIKSLLAAIAESDIDGALTMATLEGAKAYIDALKDLTAICHDRPLAEKLVVAILRRGCRDSRFIPIGVQLLSELTGKFCVQSNSWSNTYLHAFLKERAEVLQKVNTGMERCRSQYLDFDLALRHVTVSRSCGDSDAIIDILSADGSSSLNAPLYDERYANLQSFFTRLEQARLMY